MSDPYYFINIPLWQSETSIFWSFHSPKFSFFCKKHHRGAFQPELSISPGLQEAYLSTTSYLHIFQAHKYDLLLTHLSGTQSPNIKTLSTFQVHTLMTLFPRGNSISYPTRDLERSYNKPVTVWIGLGRLTTTSNSFSSKLSDKMFPLRSIQKKDFDQNKNLSKSIKKFESE